MTEAASQQAQRLNQQMPPDHISKPVGTRRQSTTITYTESNFPRLPRKQGSQQSTHNTLSKTTLPTTNPSNNQDIAIDSLNAKLKTLEQQVQQQEEKLTTLQNHLQQQQEAIQRLTQLAEDQQRNVTKLTESVNQLMTTVTNLEHTTNTILQYQRKDPPSPDVEQPIKRSRLRSEDTNSAHLYRPPPEDVLSDEQNMDQEDPNESPHHRHQPTLNK